MNNEISAARYLGVYASIEQRASREEIQAMRRIMKFKRSLNRLSLLSSVLRQASEPSNLGQTESSGVDRLP